VSRVAVNYPDKTVAIYVAGIDHQRLITGTSG